MSKNRQLEWTYKYAKKFWTGISVSQNEIPLRTQLEICNVTSALVMLCTSSFIDFHIMTVWHVMCTVFVSGNRTAYTAYIQNLTYMHKVSPKLIPKLYVCQLT